MDLLQEFLKETGFYTPELINSLTAEYKEDDEKKPDPKELAKLSRETMTQIIIADNRKEIEKGAGDKAREAAERKLKKEINTSFKLGHTTRELEKIGGEEEITLKSMLVAVDATHATAIEAIKTDTDEKLRTDLTELSDKYRVLKEERDDIETSSIVKIEEARNEGLGKLATMQKETLYSNTLDKMEFGSAKDLDLKKKWIQNEIEDNYQVDPNTGELKDKETGGPAKNFTGNGHYQNVTEAATYLFEKREWGKQVNSSDKFIKPGFKGKFTTDDLSDGGNAILERAAKAAEDGR